VLLSVDADVAYCQRLCDLLLRWRDFHLGEIRSWVRCAHPDHLHASACGECRINRHRARTARRDSRRLDSGGPL